jgi:retrotransposon gag protein
MPTRPIISAAPASRNEEIKARNPKPYDGEDPSQLYAFILQTTLALEARASEFPDERAKIAYAISYLEGAALEWSYPLFRATEPPPYMTNSALFFEQLEKFFGDSEMVIAEQLLQLKQTTTVAKYSQEFRRLANRVDWNDHALRTHFYSGLKYPVKLEIARAKIPDKLDDLITSALSVDHVQRENLALAGPVPRPSDLQPSRRDPRRDAPSATGPRRHLTEQERELRIKNGLCLYCGGEGHIIRTCPQRLPRPVARASVAAWKDVEPQGNEQTQSM